MYEVGDCYLIETNLDKNGRLNSHFFVVILKTTHNQIVIVNFDKTRGLTKFDKTVIIQSGDGAVFITEESYANYYQAELTDVDGLKYLVETGKAKYKGVIDSDVLQKLCDGVLKSKQTPIEVRDIFEDQIYEAL